MLQLGLINSWHGAGLWMVLNMAAALLLGWFVGNERYFCGRAAGSQVYCLACVTSLCLHLALGLPGDVVLGERGTRHCGRSNVGHRRHPHGHRASGRRHHREERFQRA